MGQKDREFQEFGYRKQNKQMDWEEARGWGESRASGRRQERLVKRQDASLTSAAEKLSDMKTEKGVHQLWAQEGH